MNPSIRNIIGEKNEKANSQTKAIEKYVDHDNKTRRLNNSESKIKRSIGTKYADL